MNLNDCLINKDISYICKNEYKFFLNKDNVVGVGLGYKIKNGFCTNIKAIKVFVKRKMPINKLTATSIIPSVYKGIKTDVIESGCFKFQSLTSKIRPALGGYSIGPAQSRRSYGSIGCLVTDGNNTYILSSNHVLTERNNLRIGAPILQPSLRDSGEGELDVVANLSKFIPVRPVPSINYSDCAIAKVTNLSLVSGEIALIGRPSGTSRSTVGKSVLKSGRTSEKTSGTITAIDVTCIFSYLGEPREYLFREQIMTTHMSEVGDSGAVILDRNRKVLGLLVGDSDSNSVYSSIFEVLQKLNVRIVS